MKKILMVSIAVLGMAVASGANAASGYNDPGDDKIYTNCVAKALKTYEDANGRSRVSGQTKAQAWCTCMWNESPDDFSGDLIASRYIFGKAGVRYRRDLSLVFQCARCSPCN